MRQPFHLGVGSAPARVVVAAFTQGRTGAGVPADREMLSRRARQPGHDRGWVLAEDSFVDVARAVLPPCFEVVAKPADLRSFYAGGVSPLGLEPDAKVLDLRTGRYVFVEVKRQGATGNAEERAYRHHTVRFVRSLAHWTSLPYHAYVSVLCDELATRRRYTTKIAAHIEDGQYLLWRGYDPALLAGFLDFWRREHLSPGRDDATSCASLAHAVPTRAAPVVADTLFAL